MLEFYSNDCFFFFQAEDGIRDDLVTGVQTCALPIWACHFSVHPIVFICSIRKVTRPHHID